MKKQQAELYTSPKLKSILDRIPSKQREQTRVRMMIAARIDDFMQKEELNKIQLAQRMNKRPSEITKWLSGTHNFTVDTLAEIAFELKAPFADLFKTKQAIANKPVELILRVTNHSPLIKLTTPWSTPVESPYYFTASESEVSYGTSQKWIA